jgi:Zn-dependent protease
MKPNRNTLQWRVLQRLEAGLPPSRWQQFLLHLQTVARQLRRKRFSTLWFHGQGIARLVWKPFTVCRLFGVPVQFHITWFVYPAGFLAWLLFDYDRPWKMFLVLLMLLVICASLLAHEFAHVLAARKFGIGSRRVILIPPGAVAELDSALDSPNEFWIALAGPLASLLLAGIFWAGFHEFASWHKTWRIVWLYHWMRAWEFGFNLNLFMAMFNLLPCFPMDGGRILRSSLAMILGRAFPQRARPAFFTATLITVRWVAWPVGVGMIVFAILNLDYWIYLFFFPLLILVAEIEYQELRDHVGSTGDDRNTPDSSLCNCGRTNLISPSDPARTACPETSRR